MRAAGGASLIGESARRRDGDELLTGRSVFTADLDLPRTAHLAVARSSYAHAHLRSVELGAARRHPRVLAVIGGTEAAEHCDPITHNLDPAGLGGRHADVRCLAVEKVRYVGEPIAAVVAETEADAQAAAALVAGDYEPLPVVLDAEQALAPGAPRLYEEWDSNEMIVLELGSEPSEAAPSDGVRRLRGRLSVQRSTAAPIEPRAYLADWDETGRRLTWYGTTQNPHPLRSMLAQALRLNESQVRVVMPRLGGSFGLKMHGYPEEVLVGLLARRTGRPVRWIEDRRECMLAGAREQQHQFEVAFDTSGRVLDIFDEVVVNHGAAAAGPGWGMAFVGGVTVAAGYDIRGCRVRSRVVLTNKSPWAGARGFGKETATAVTERVMDLVADACALDPVEVRRRNLVRSDQFPFTTASGLCLDSGDYHRLLDEVLERVQYTRARATQAAARADGRLHGVGIAFELTPEGADIPGALVGGADTSTVRMDAEGGVLVLTGVTSPGNGNDTAIAQVVGQALGVALAGVRVIQGDTDLCPYGYGNLSSRAAVTGTASALLAACEIAAKLQRVAANMLHIAEADRIVLADGMASNADDPSQQLPIAAVARAVYSLAYILADGIEPTLEATRTYRPTNIRHTPDAHGHINPFHTFGYSVHAMVVEIDPDTGHVTVLRHVLGHDCGTQLNPALVEGQIHGSVCAGMGAALSEELTHDHDGTLITDSFKTYLLPRAAEITPVAMVSQVTPSPFTPLGAKGVGETGLGGTQAALLNAVNDALRPAGAEINAFPLTPVAVLDALGGPRHDPGHV